jgi:hypothetical protein
VTLRVSHPNRNNMVPTANTLGSGGLMHDASNILALLE